MMNDHSAPLARAIDAQDRFASSGPMVRHHFIHRNISTGPPDRRFNQVEVGLGAAGDVPRMAARTDEKIAPPRRTGGWRLVPLLYGLAAFFMIAGPVPAASQPDSEVGSKLVGTFAVGPALQGWSVALSADGNTAIMGGVTDNHLTGAAWIFTHSSGAWTQQGNKLVGAGAVEQGGQGWSVALSADGNTAIVGGPYDSSNTGAAWIFTRSGDVWTQQGSKLVGSGAVGKAVQGVSVSLSADGKTAIVGGTRDNLGTGAAWIYTRSGDLWIQQGSKLVGADAVDSAYQGYTVALSADGNTAVVGGPLDNSNTGALWVYSRSGGLWNQQGRKLVGIGAVGQAGQGFSVALSADGNTAVVGGPLDNSHTGAAWVYSRGGTVWTQQGDKLVGTGTVGIARQGHSVALSADGNTAIVGGPYDNSDTGAVWVHTRNRGLWTQQDNKLVGTGTVGHAEQGFSVALSADGSKAIAGGIADNRITGAAWVHTRSGGTWTPIPAPYPGF
jgi:antibiotic biosynthesis monooxygenase (ABM) superfamily enzyme